MRVERIEPGRQPPARLVGAVLTRSVRVASGRLDKGRKLTADDLAEIAELPSANPQARPLHVIVLGPGDVHEDDAALRLAQLVAGAGLRQRGPAESRVDLLAEAAGVAAVDVAALERLNRVDPLEVFTVFDGQVVAPGDLVASVKVAPQVVERRVIARAEAIVARTGPVVSVAPFRPRRVAVIAKESLAPAARARFERSVRAKVETLGSSIVEICYVEDSEEAVESALGGVLALDPPVDLVLTAGTASTDPADATFVALRRLGGRVVRRGVPAHPGSMLWLGRLGEAAVLGLPSCGAFSRATAADLILPRLLAGEPASARTIARLGHGGILSRDMRFRFPAYARDLEAPDG